MFANGFARAAILVPWLGDHRARQVSTATAVAIVAAAAWLLVRAFPGRTGWLRVGLLWTALTLAFEFLLGRYVSGLSWSELAADYDVTRGRLWPLVPLATLLAPSWWARRL
jgi:hypothetical protein